MNFNLFLIIIIALIIIFCIILYNGLRILLTVEKEKGIVKYDLKVTILKIPIFKRNGTKGTSDSDESEDQDEDLEKTKEEEKSESDDGSSKDQDTDSKDESSKTKNEDSKDESSKNQDKDSEEETEEEDKGLLDKYKEYKPIIKKLIQSKEELKVFLKNFLKTIDLKRLEGNLIIGLSDHTTTVKIASLIWSIGAILNSTKPTCLTVEPRFTEVVVDFEGKMELKLNLLLLLIYGLVLLSKKDIRELIKEFL